MGSPSHLSVQISRAFRAPPERVFDAWLDPATVGQWLFATPTGQMRRTDIDARVGGAFCIIENRDGEDVDHRGLYLEMDRPCRLAFTLHVGKYALAVTPVAIDIVPEQEGCRLILTHDNVYADYEARTQEGWAMILNGLAARLGE